MPHRTVRTKYPPHREDLGDLVTRRPAHSLEQLNPFLFINHHGPQIYPPRNHGLPFGPHPHRGFETVTFIVEGSLVHRDTAGHESAIGAGGIQWMTAGSGIEHSETSSAEFIEQGGPLEILQLWVNLPARLKMSEPAYTGLQESDIPSLVTSGGLATVHLIAGTLDGHAGPIDSLTKVTMLTLELRAGGAVTLPAPGGRRVFLYVVRGALQVAGSAAYAFELVDLNDDGESVELAATHDSLIIFAHADPLHEPIAAYGPFVMNTEAEIRQTVRDYQSGAFRSNAER